LYYTFDGTDPDNFYPKYGGTPIDIPKGASEISVIAYRHDRVISRQVNYSLDELRQSFDKKKGD
ncbi:MAG TPA: FN3 associated domain-containing protein, partial [Hanamia sp.]